MGTRAVVGSLATMIVVGVAGCSGSPDPGAASVVSSPPATPSATASATVSATPTVSATASASPAGCVATTFESLSAQQRLGQLLMVGFDTNAPLNSLDDLVAKEHEMAALAEAGAEPRSLLVTFGANGAAWDGATAPAHPVAPGEVVDTTGAGDAFCGALAAALARGADRAEALDAALAAGAAAVRHPGAQRDPELT